MYFQFLIEDKSGAELVNQIMIKVIAEHPETVYDCKGL